MASEQTLAVLVVQVKAKTKAYKREMKGVTSGLQGIKSTMAGTMLGIGALWAGRALLGSVKKFTSGLIEQRMEMARLQSTLKATGNIAGWTAGKFDILATKLQRSTTFTKTEVLKASTLASTFINIREDQVEPTIQAILDLSTIMRTGLRQSALQLSKVLSNPVQLLGALRRSGVSFNKVQEDMIKTLWRSGKAIESQNLILKIVREQGLEQAAQAMRGTFGGAIKGVTNDLQQLTYDLTIALTATTNFTGAVNQSSGAVQGWNDDINSMTRIGTWDRWIEDLKHTAKVTWAVMRLISDMIVGAMHQLWDLKKMLKEVVVDAVMPGPNRHNKESILGFGKQALMDQLNHIDTMFERIDKASATRDKKLKWSAIRRAKAETDANSKIKKSAVDTGNALKNMFKTGGAEDILRMAQEAALKGMGKLKAAAVVAPPNNKLLNKLKKIDMDAKIELNKDINKLMKAGSITEILKITNEVLERNNKFLEKIVGNTDGDSIVIS